jgi:hypothetical protein
LKTFYEPTVLQLNPDIVSPHPDFPAFMRPYTSSIIIAMT